MCKHICEARFLMQRDAQVLDRMLILTEDWARSLPQPQFAEALSMVLHTGVRVPMRLEEEKAPMLDVAAYEVQRREQLARQSSLRRRFDGQRARGADRSHGEYDQLGASPEDVRVRFLCFRGLC
jgi:hypothetical protein